MRVTLCFHLTLIHFQASGDADTMVFFMFLPDGVYPHVKFFHTVSRHSRVTERMYSLVLEPVPTGTVQFNSPFYGFTPLGGQTYTTTVFTSYIVLSAVLERHVGLPTEFRKPEKTSVKN